MFFQSEGTSYKKNYLKKSGLVGVRMIEAFDLMVIRQIMKADEAKPAESKLLWDSDVKKLDAYLQTFAETNERELIYEFGSTSDCDYGRLYAHRSFGHFWSYIKNTVSYTLEADGSRIAIYTDIDMINCQANIMWQIATVDLGMTETELPQFKLYVKNRESFFKEVMKHYSVSKRLAKLLFTSLMNGGSVRGWKDDNKIHHSDDLYILELFKKESELIAKRFIGENPEIYTRITSDVEFKAETNITSKVFSRVIKNIESLCLEKLYNRLGRPRYGTLEHDGMRIRRDDYSDDEIWEAINGAAIDIQNDVDLGFKLEFKPKIPTANEFLPLAAIIDVNNDSEFEYFDFDVFESLKTYKEKKKYFEIFHFLGLTPHPRYYHLEWRDNGDPSGGRLELNEWCAAKDLKTAFYNRFFIEMVKVVKKNGKGEESAKLVPKKVKFIDRWLEDPTIRTYNQIDFIPSNTIASKLHYWNGKSQRKYNSFLGYSLKCKSYDAAAIDKTIYESMLKTWTDLVFELCGANRPFYELYINALAHKIQFPNEKSRAGCFIFKSLQGTGKNTHLAPFEIILGEYYISSSEANDFWGTYADSFYRKILINLDEMQLSRDGNEDEGKIKSFITEEWRTMNQKYKQVRKVRNVALPIVTTNRPKPFAIDFRTGDRRMLVTEATTVYQQYGEKWWNGMHKIFKSDKFISIFYHFLSNRDLSGVSWKQVKTPAYLEMALQYVSIEILWLGDWVEKQINIYNAFNKDKWDTRFIVSELYDNYISFCTDYRIKQDMILNRHKFSTSISDLNLGITTKKSSVMVFDMDLCHVRDELIKRRLIVKDEMEPASVEPSVEVSEGECIFEKYGINPDEL